MTPEEIRALRKSLGLTLEGFAHWFKLSGAKPGDTVRSWEKERRVPSGPALVLLEAFAEGFVPKHIRDEKQSQITK